MGAGPEPLRVQELFDSSYWEDMVAMASRSNQRFGELTAIALRSLVRQREQKRA